MRPSTAKYAALLAVRNSIGIFLAAIAMIPVLSVVHRISYHTWYVDWVLLLKVNGALSALVFCFYFSAQVLEEQAAENRERTNRLVFPAAMWLRGIYLACMAIGIVATVGMYREGDRGWVLYVPVVFMLTGYFPWPRAIRLGDTEIRKRDGFLRLTRIPYGEIERVVADGSRGEVVVFGKKGEMIVHTNMHVGRENLLERLVAISGKKATLVGRLS
jgi:hypothetical protein